MKLLTPDNFSFNNLISTKNSYMDVTTKEENLVVKHRKGQHPLPHVSPLLDVDAQPLLISWPSIISATKATAIFLLLFCAIHSPLSIPITIFPLIFSYTLLSLLLALFPCLDQGMLPVVQAISP